MSTCERCGLDEATMPINDAIDAIRTFPARYQRTAGRFAREMPNATGAAATLVWRASRAIAHAVASLHHALAWEPVSPQPLPAAEAPSLSAAMEALDSACRALVAACDRVPWEAWFREHVLPDGTREQASRVVARAAHEGAHELRELNRMLPPPD